MTSVAETLASHPVTPVLVNLKLYNRCPFYRALEHDSFIAENLPAAVPRNTIKWPTA